MLLLLLVSMEIIAVYGETISVNDEDTLKVMAKLIGMFPAIEADSSTLSYDSASYVIG